MSGAGEPTALAGGPPVRTAGRDATLVAGDMLNGIYRVERFIARGGMGEVFEGINVETEERVAIKAIRSHLASDPKVVALFRKEARVLTHIAHPAIVQYRVFARDPSLDLHYIVTDFINGEPITAHLDGARPSVRDVVTLARRLATGLEAAHDHGAIHRDMSPDNVLLPDGRIDRAKIIDFGIAKSLDLSGETVVGDGFAGKLGYVAPEQFGDYGRQIGPWTDVYSTALVLLAYARGKAPAMGTTLSEAVERRRIGPDVNDLPLALAPLIERMLVPDPALRIRSMREVLLALDAVRLPDEGAVPVEAERPQEAVRLAGPEPSAAPATMFVAAPFVPADVTDVRDVGNDDPERERPAVVRGAGGPIRRRWLPLAGLPLGCAAITAAAFGLHHSTHQARSVPTLLSTPVAGTASGQAPAAGPASSSVSCSWSDAIPASASQCAALDALRPVKVDGVGARAMPLSLSSSEDPPAGCTGGAFDLRATDDRRGRDFSLVVLQPDGRLLQLAAGHADFAGQAKQLPGLFRVGPGGIYRAKFCVPATGPTAAMLIESRVAPDLGLKSGVAAPPPADFARRIAQQRHEDGLRVFAVWAIATSVRAVSVGLDRTPALPASVPVAVPQSTVPATIGPMGESTRAQATMDTAAANRRELDRLQAVQSGTGDTATANSCRQYDGSWKDLGALGHDACITRAIKGQCQVIFAMYKNRLFRRQNGQIQEQRGSRWRDIEEDAGC